MDEDLEIKLQLESFENMLTLENYVDMMLKHVLKETNLSLRECEILMYVYQHDQTGTSELAEFFKVTRTLISVTTGQLMKAQLIQIQPSWNDRRRVDISLTKTGRRQVVAAKKQITNNLKSMGQNKELLRLANQIASVSQQLSELK
ncbi:MarR family winged helix-turn-helix transcriptional regulator [Lactiplantibacillus carotarum]|uniref:MarR family winged helix-turn-helix transcriptional regulator n=1 Tax=Lactiplantibacillus carotarum TaxID=2993456 RepID=UPI00247A4769|nr:MarR family transcriptional regulator [Lactiplantibacillus carotarum]